MSRSHKSDYTDKQKKQAGYGEESEKRRGRPRKNTEKTGWATANKQTNEEKIKKENK